MTEMQFVRAYFPSADAQAAHAILWECTSWPFAGIEGARLGLASLAAKANDVAQALYISYGEDDRAWAEFKAFKATFPMLAGGNPT